MTDKEIFLQIKTHLLTQGKKSTAQHKRFNGKLITYCAYRSPGGLKCAVGCIIKDEYYTPQLEGEIIESDAVQEAVIKSLGLETLPEHTYSMLSNLQLLHDTDSPQYWKNTLQDYENMHFNSDGSYRGIN